MRIAIVDDQADFRKALRKMVEKEPGLSVVAEAKNGLDAIGAVIEHKPDVVLMGISKPAAGGLNATKVIRSKFPQARIITLSVGPDSTMAAMSCQAGSCCHLCKTCSPNDIISAIRNHPEKK